MKLDKEMIEMIQNEVIEFLITEEVENLVYTTEEMNTRLKEIVIGLNKSNCCKDKNYIVSIAYECNGDTDYDYNYSDIYTMGEVINDLIERL